MKAYNLSEGTAAAVAALQEERKLIAAVNKALQSIYGEDAGEQRTEEFLQKMESAHQFVLQMIGQAVDAASAYPESENVL